VIHESTVIHSKFAYEPRPPARPIIKKCLQASDVVPDVRKLSWIQWQACHGKQLDHTAVERNRGSPTMPKWVMRWTPAARLHPVTLP
jgi:hypothetical protein